MGSSELEGLDILDGAFFEGVIFLELRGGEVGTFVRCGAVGFGR